MQDNSTNRNKQDQIKDANNEYAKNEKSDQPSLNIIPLNIKDYTVLNKISDSNMTEVFQVKSNKTDELFAAKIFHKSEKKDTSKLFSRQVNILSQLSHLSIVKFIGYSLKDFKNKSNPTIITEMLGSGSLYDIIELDKKENGSVNWNSTMKLINIYAIASAMSHIHSRDIMHRNLRPRNIFINEFLCPKIGGFIFAKFLNEEDDENEDEIMGQAAFVAPEIGNNKGYSKASDVYSFSMVVYQIMTSQEPFENLSYFQTLIKAQKERPKFETPIPEAYQKLIESCWDQDPNKRPTFDQIVSQLQTNKKFITDDVDEGFYLSFIKLVKNQQEGADITSAQKQLFSKFINDSIYERLNAYIEGKRIANEEEILRIIKSLKIEQIDINDFEKLTDVDSGGFGQVFTIRHKATQKVYAAKKLKKQNNQTVDFLKEIKILSDLNHPLIMKLIGYSLVGFKGNPKLIIVSEYIRNGTLESILSQEREINSKIRSVWNSTMKLINIYGIASAICYLHSLDIIHSDIKPDNVLVDDYLFPKICDFGLSMKMKSKQNTVKRFACTYNFAAPEIFKSGNFSKKSDVYAFGMLLYEMMLKRIPFSRCDHIQILEQVTNNERPKIDKPIPAAFREMIESCWDQDPDKRPTFDQIVSDLKTKKFITEDIDEKLYLKFINLIDNQQKGGDVTKDKNEFNVYDLDSIYKENSIPSHSSSSDYYDYSTITSSNDLIMENLKKLKKVRENENSAIYEFKDKNTGKLFLITKSKNKIADLNQETISDMKNEADQLVKLMHPAIQRFYDFSLCRSKNQFKQMKVSEYLNYRTLSEVIINKIDEWTSTKKLINIYGIASGMSYLHSNQILHPYLNPNNVIVDDNLHPKLTEIGCLTNTENTSNFSSTTTSTLKFNDSFYYLSPEKLKSNDNVTEKSDVFSFGLIAYAIATNKIASQEEDKPSQFIEKVIKDICCLKLKGDVPKGFLDMIEKCLSNEPDDRPSFIEILNELENNQFLTDDIDKEEYGKYIQYIKEIKE